MYQHKLIKNFTILSCIIHLIHCLPQDTSKIKRGRYIPELYGAHLGKYVPDDSGKYYHIHIPYNGGYGDAGIKYVHDARGNLVPLSAKPLGPKDHIRFMIDFNFNNSGWQIINFEWLRDGDENYKYKFVNENQLFMDNDEYGDAGEELSSDIGADSGQNNNEKGEEPSPDTSAGRDQNNNDENGVHIEGEYSNKKGYNYSYNNNEEENNNSNNLQQAIREVIFYIENNIIPSL